MPRIVLHCGSFKTGSSAIQNAFWNSREALRAQGVLYPDAGLILHEPEVGRRHSRFVYGFKDAPRWSSLVDALIAEIAASGCHTVVLSSEAWSRPGAVPSLSRLLERLAAVGHVNVSGTVYLRNRDEYARAVYREFTRRRGNVHAFEEYVRAQGAIFDHVRVVETLQRALAGRLRVASYEDVEDVLHDFLHHEQLAVVPGVATGEANRSLDAVAVEAIRILNLKAPRMLKHFPGIDVLLEAYGLSVGQRAQWQEPVVRWKERWGYARRLQRVSGLQPRQVAALLEARNKTPVQPVNQLTPMLEQVVMRWLNERETAPGARQRLLTDVTLMR